MKQSTIATLIVIGVVACLMAASQPTDKEMDVIRKQMGDIGLRVSRLEHASGVPSGAVHHDIQSTGDTHVARSMIVGGMNEVKGRGVDPDQAADMQDDIDALQNTVDYHKDNAARVAGDTYRTSGYYSDGHYGYNHSNAGRERAERSQQSMADRYGTEAQVKRQKLEDMQHHANQNHQIIHGHDGDVIFTLRSKTNLSGAITGISIGDMVTWAGTRVSADATSEVWDITSITKVPQ